MSEDDYCVYARNILGQLDGIANPTTGFTADVVPQNTATSNSLEPNMGLLVTGALVLLFCLFAFFKKKQ